jgi:FtsZ-binding cell division protein ZapB
MVLLMPSDSFADTLIHNAAADYLVEFGEKLEARGDVQGAIHEFSKALLVQPNNQKALAHLKNYGLEQGLYKPTQITAERPLIISMDTKAMTIPDPAEDAVKAEKVTETVEEVSAVKNPEDQEAMFEKYNQAIEQSLYYQQKFEELKSKNDHLVKYVEDQYHHQNKIIHVLEDYLHLREETLEDNKDEVVVQQLELATDYHALLQTLDELVQRHKSQADYLQQMGYRDALIKEKNSDLYFMKNKLEQADHIIGEQQRIINGQDAYIDDFEKEFLSVQNHYDQQQK